MVRGFRLMIYFGARSYEDIIAGETVRFVTHRKHPAKLEHGAICLDADKNSRAESYPGPPKIKKGSLFKRGLEIHQQEAKMAASNYNGRLPVTFQAWLPQVFFVEILMTKKKSVPNLTLQNDSGFKGLIIKKIPLQSDIANKWCGMHVKT